MASFIMFNKFKLNINKRQYSTTKNKQLFSKILVANRGEVACKIMRTCKLLGIKTVSVYTEQDIRNNHTLFADESIFLGKEKNDNYYNINRIVEAAKLTGAEAVHPGHEYLSKSHKFVNSLSKHGIKFIGPTAKTLKMIENRIDTKQIASNLGLSVVPGPICDVRSEEDVIKYARDIGYPVIIKAASGSDGNAIHIVKKEKELLSAFNKTKKQALELYGNDQIMIEKLIEYPRHIDFQILADKDGNIVHLNERERTIQRLFKCVIEESPSSFITPEVRHRMSEQAIKFAKSIKLQSAATVEMLIDENRNFYFLEVNPSLSLHHTLSELITGVDIVEQMIKIAANQPLSIQQTQLAINGWSIGATINAEDPINHYSQSTGLIECYVEAEMTDDIKIDSEVTEGVLITNDSSKILSKLSCRGNDRMDAIENFVKSLDTFRIMGIQHNISLLRNIVTNSRFLAGELCTEFFAEEYPEGFTPQFLSVERDQLIASSALMYLILSERNTFISGQLNSFRHSNIEEFIVIFDDKEYLVEVNLSSDSELAAVKINGEQHNIEFQWDAAAPYFEAVINQQQVIIQYFGQYYDGLYLQHCGHNIYVKVRTPLQHKMWKFMTFKRDEIKVIQSPKSGKIVTIGVVVGEEVFPGQRLFVIESNFEKIIIRSNVNGIVKSINVKNGETVPQSYNLIEIENK